MPDIITNPNHNKARHDISFYLHNINSWRAHESTTNCYSNYNKTNLNKTICIFYGIYRVCSNGSIRSQRSLLLTWSPFDASPITELFMILVSRARRPATFPLYYYPGTLSFSHISASHLKLRQSRMNCHVCLGATITKRDW